MTATHFTSVLARGTTTGSTDTVLQSRDGVAKFHNRPTAANYVVEVKGEPTIITGTHYGIECTVDAKPSASDTGAGIRGGGFIGRLAATYTKTGGSLIGGYSQVCNLGTINGAGVMVAGQYSLIENGGTYTAVSHLAGLWVDSHLTSAVSAGSTNMVYISNNGTTAFDDVFYIYPGNKITNLFNIAAEATGMVGAKVDADIAYAHYRKVTVKYGSTTGWLLLGFDA